MILILHKIKTRKNQNHFRVMASLVKAHMIMHSLANAEPVSHTDKRKKKQQDKKVDKKKKRPPLPKLIIKTDESKPIPTIQGGAMRVVNENEPIGTINGLYAIGLDKFKKDHVEVSPEVDEHGEFTEVQVLEEGDAFDPDAILEKLIKKPTHPQCPRCHIDLRRGSVKCKDGDKYNYYRCPATKSGIKCYVTCEASDVDQYLERVIGQTHDDYYNIELDRFQCRCHNPLVLATSHSDRNPNRLYLKCAKRQCDFFQWIDEPPEGVAEDILIHGYCE